MKITSVTVHQKGKREGSRVRGVVSVLIDDCFAIHNIRILEGDNGLFIAMPNRPTANGGYRDVAHPINREVRKLFEDAIFEEFNKAEEE